MLTLYPDTLLITSLIIVFKNRFFSILSYIIMLSVKSYFFFFLICMPFIFFSCLTATARIPRMTVNRVLRTHILAFFSILGGWHSVFHINYNLNDRFLIFGFWTLSCWKSSFLFLLRWYFPHGHWILSKAIFFF